MELTSTPTAPNSKEIKFKTSPSLFFYFRAVSPLTKQWAVRKREKVPAIFWQAFLGAGPVNCYSNPTHFCMNGLPDMSLEKLGISTNYFCSSESVASAIF